MVERPETGITANVSIVEKLEILNNMIPSLNALKTGLQNLLLDRVDIHQAISTLEIVEPQNTKLIESLRNSEHDVWQVCEMLMDMINRREEMSDVERSIASTT